MKRLKVHFEIVQYEAVLGHLIRTLNSIKYPPIPPFIGEEVHNGADTLEKR